MPGQAKALGVLADRLRADAAFHLLEPVDEPGDPDVFAPGDDPLGKAVLQHEEPEVPQSRPLRGDRGELVEHLVHLRRFHQGEPARRAAVGGSVAVRDQGSDIVPDDVHLPRQAEPGQQLVDVLGQGGRVVAAGRGVGAARAAQVRRDDGEVPGERRHHLAPHVPGLRVPVQQHQSRAAAAAGVVQPDAVRLGGVLGEAGRDR